MRVPVSWLREYVALPADLSVQALADRLNSRDVKSLVVHRDLGRE